MQDKIYREEYIREQARIEARHNAQPKQKKAGRLQSYFVPAALAGLLFYALIITGGISGLSPGAFIALDFLIPAGILIALFLWARWA